MRASLACSLTLLATAGCSSAALGQQFAIDNPGILDSVFNVLPSYNGGNTGSGDLAGAIYDGGIDAFDGWMYPSTSLGGLSLNRRVDILGTLNTYRHIDTYTNNTAGPLSVLLNMYGNLGSDGAENVVQSDAYSFVSLDAFPFDPVVGLMNGNNAWTAASITRTQSFDNVDLYYTLTLQPGESISLMWATFLAYDLTDRSGDIALAQSTVNAMLANPQGTGLYTGLTVVEIASIVNWSIPTPGAAALLGLGGLAGLRRRR